MVMGIIGKAGYLVKFFGRKLSQQLVHFVTAGGGTIQQGFINQR